MASEQGNFVWTEDDVEEVFPDRSRPPPVNVHAKVYKPVQPSWEDRESIQDKRDNCIRGLMMTIHIMSLARPIIWAIDQLENRRYEIDYSRRLFRAVYNIHRKFTLQHCDKKTVKDFYKITSFDMNFIDFAQRETFLLGVDLENVCKGEIHFVKSCYNSTILDTLTKIDRRVRKVLEKWLVRHHKTKREW